LILKELDISDEIHPGIIKDETIHIRVTMDDGKKKTLTLRRVVFWDDIGTRLFVYMTKK
jgi:hypothetical protein